MNKFIFCTVFLMFFATLSDSKNVSKYVFSNYLSNGIENNGTDSIRQPQINIWTVSNKIYKKEKLTIGDYDCICDYLLNVFCKEKNIDGREGIGYSIYQYFQNNQPHNSSFYLYLENQGTYSTDEIFEYLIYAMSIDICDEYKSFDEFVRDFGMFKNSVSARNTFEVCIQNCIE